MMSGALAAAGVGLLLMAGVQAGDEWTTLLGGFLVAGAGVGLLNPRLRLGLTVGLQKVFIRDGDTQLGVNLVLIPRR
jgi:hypothetical protein